jgi:hypothetical protein
VEIGTSSRVLAMPSMVQPVAITKLVSLLRGGTSCKIIPLHIQHVPFTIVVSKLVENSKRFDKKHVEPINPSFTILDNISKSLEFLYGSLPLTPHLNRYRSRGYFDLKYRACLEGIHNTHNNL